VKRDGSFSQTVRDDVYLPAFFSYKSESTENIILADFTTSHRYGIPKTTCI
jgi:hypothetical protein